MEGRGSCVGVEGCSIVVAHRRQGPMRVTRRHADSSASSCEKQLNTKMKLTSRAVESLLYVQLKVVLKLFAVANVSLSSHR